MSTLPDVRRLLFVLASLSLVAFACGDDDDGSEAVAEAIEDAIDEEGGDAIEDLANIGGECVEASTALFGAMGGAAAAMMGDTSELEEGADALEEFADKAPDDIADDVAIVAAAVKEFVEELADMDFDPSSGEEPSAEDMERLQELGAVFEDEEVSEASDRLTAWFTENCETGSGE